MFNSKYVWVLQWYMQAYIYVLLQFFDIFVPSTDGIAVRHNPCHWLLLPLNQVPVWLAKLLYVSVWHNIVLKDPRRQAFIKHKVPIGSHNVRVSSISECPIEKAIVLCAIGLLGKKAPYQAIEESVGTIVKRNRTEVEVPTCQIQKGRREPPWPKTGKFDVGSVLKASRGARFL